jgi:hypothetical protein
LDTKPALQAETAISLLSPSDHDVYRKMTAEHINTLQLNNNSHPKYNAHPEARTIKTIKTKLKKSEAMITHTDKGNSLVILPIKQYDSKIQDFIQANNSQTATKDPTKNFQSQIRKLMKDSKNTNPS